MENIGLCHHYMLGVIRTIAMSWHATSQVRQACGEVDEGSRWTLWTIPGSCTQPARWPVDDLPPGVDTGLADVDKEATSVGFNTNGQPVLPQHIGYRRSNARALSVL